MNMVMEVLQQPWTQRLGWTLLHFIWQGTVLAGTFALARRFLRDASPNARYQAGCGTLVVMMVVLGITYLKQEMARDSLRPSLDPNPTAYAPAQPFHGPIDVHTVKALPQPSQAQGSRGVMSSQAFPQHLAKFIPWFVAAWFIGVGIFSLRLFAGWLKLLSLKRRHTRPADEQWLEKLHQIKSRLAISRPVRLLESMALEVPVAIGWLSPIILLPASSLLGLTPAQVESILAHELAHIRRHDYLVNMLQCLAETFLFYHPAVWWVSKCIRVERENCCDDLAVQVCGDPLSYAKALATLEELRSSPASLALAANGRPLLQRIRRLVLPRPNYPRPHWKQGSTSFLSVLLVLAALFSLPLAHSQKRESAGMSPTNAMPSVTRTNGEHLSIEDTKRRLDETILEEVKWDGLPLSEVLSHLGRELKRCYPAGPEIRFSMARSSAARSFDLGATLLKIQPAVKNVSVSQLLEVMVKVAEPPIKYNVGDGRVVFWEGNPYVNPLYTRTFKLEPDKLPKTISTNLLAANPLSTLLNVFARECQVNLTNWGRSLWYKESMGVLTVRATLEELDRIEKFMGKFEAHAPAPAKRGSALLKKMESMPPFASVEFKQATLTEVARRLQIMTQERDPQHAAINFIVASTPSDPGDPEILDEINLKTMHNVKLLDLLQAIVHASASPLQFAVEDYGVVFFRPRLTTRRFRLNPNTLAAGLNLKYNAGIVAGESAKALTTFSNVLVQDYGVDLGVTGKTVQFEHHMEALTVRVSEDDMLKVEKLVRFLNEAPPQLTFEVKVVELVEQKEKPFKLEDALPGQKFYHSANTNKFTASNVGLSGVGKNAKRHALVPTNGFQPPSLAILTDRQFRQVLQALEKRSNVDILAAPKVTTLSSRQTQIKVLDIHPFPDQKGGVEKVELGPIVDLVGFLNEDKVTISVTAIGLLREFIGFDLATGRTFDPIFPSENPSGTPIFRERSARGVAELYDGQTLVLDAGVLRVNPKIKKGSRLPADGQLHVRRLMFFVTPFLIDPAGNSLYSKEQLPFTTNSVPPQMRE